MPTDNQSEKIRNYAIAVFCAILTISALFFVLKIAMWTSSEEDITVWSECNNNSANVFIGANTGINDVKCIALDKEFFSSTEVVIGDLSKNDEDVCRFKLSEYTAEPLRFEVLYNGKVKREVCSWQNYPSNVD